MASSQLKKKQSPEEEVRQKVYHWLIAEKGFPKSAIVLERELSLLPHMTAKGSLPQRRIDLLAYESKSLKPLLLIECKAVPLSERALYQLLGYNHYIGAPYIGLINQNQLILARLDPQTQKPHFIPDLPDYNLLTAESPPLL